MAVVIGVMNIFPYSMYSDIDTNISEADNAMDIVAYLFLPSGTFSVLGIEIGLDATDTGAILTIVIGAIVGIGALVAVATHSFIPVVLSIFGIIFVPMINNSSTFLSHLFTHWDSPSLAYLGITLGVGIVILVLIHIMETPTHGDS